MKKFFGIVITLGALCFVANGTQAQCVSRARVVHHAAAVAVVTPVFAAQFVPVPLVVPAYSVGYAPQHESAGLSELAAEIKNLRLELSALRGAQQPVPKAAEAPAYVGVMIKNCAACHDKAVAVSKAKGVVLMDGPTIGDFTAEQRLKIINLVHENKMPPGRQLADKDYSELVVGLSTIAEKQPGGK
jgi:hypothetical protein